MRRRRSNWRSFGHGFVLAGLPILAFAAADYLFAPPSPSTRIDTISRSLMIGQRVEDGNAAIPAASRTQRTVDTTPTNSAAGALQQVADRETPKAPAADPHSSLVVSIQRELHRVGCYTGEADGSWTDRTRVAMRAFNDSVHVHLGTDQPDYILLTLLQGHSGKACSRPCNGVVSAGAQCIDKTIEARRVPPATLVTREAAVDRAGQATTSSAQAPVPVAPTWSTATAKAPQALPQAARSEPSPQVEAASAVVVEPQRAKEESEPLPGRMAVGARPTREPRETEDASTATAAVVPAVEPVATPAQRMVRSRPAPVARPAVAASSSKARLSRTFVELGRNSP